MTLIEAIGRLSDERAVAVLRGLMGSAPNRTEPEPEPEPDPEALQALAKTFGLADARPSDGELARRALLVLALNPAYAQPLADRLEHRPAEKFWVPGAETIALVTLALLALQTSVSVKRDNQGKITWEINKHGLDAGAFKALCEAVTELAKAYTKRISG